MAGGQRYRAVIFDRQPLWLDAVASLLQQLPVDVLARTTSLDEVTGLIDEHAPDLLVLGLQSADESRRCWGLLRDLTGERDLKVVVISSEDDEHAVEAAFAAGASAYCLKTADAADVIAAIHQSFEPSIYLAAAANLVSGTPSSKSGKNGALTKRELEIIRLVAEGRSNAELARMLWITEQTVKFHLTNIYRKLDVANRTEATRWAYLHGLLGEEGEPGTRSAQNSRTLTPRV